MEVTAHASTPLGKVSSGYGEWKNTGDERLLDTGQPAEVDAFQIGDGSEGENVAGLPGSGTASGAKSCLRSGYPDRTLREFDLSGLEAMVGENSDEMSPRLKDDSTGGLVRMPNVGPFTVPPVVEAARRKCYLSQLVVNALTDLLELNPTIQLDQAHRTTSFAEDQTLQFERAVGSEVSLFSFGMLEDILVKS